MSMERSNCEVFNLFSLTRERRKRGPLLFRLFSLVLCFPVWPLARGEQPGGEGPEPGEERLSAGAQEAFLKRMREEFERHPNVKAKVADEVEDDLLGRKVVEEGELILQRPAKALRRFHRPKAKAMMLDGALLREYNPALKKVVERDYSEAPKALGLIRAALTGQVNVLEEYFEMAVFSKPSGPGQLSEYRLVLKPRQEGQAVRSIQRVQARLREGAAFFHEIYQLPKAGHGAAVLQRFSAIQTPGKLGAEDFLEPLLEKAGQTPEKMKDD